MPLSEILAAPRKAETPPDVGACQFPASFLMFAIASPLSFA